MSILIIAEHDNQNLSAATLNTVTAASDIGKEINVLVVGHNCSNVSKPVSYTHLTLPTICSV